MPDKPAAEIDVDAATVRALLQDQAADVAALPIRMVAEGWDNTVWRIGDELAARLPRRAAAVRLVRHEHRVLPAIAARLAPTGVRVPAPIVAGAPGSRFPWPWSLVPWIDGEPGLEVPRARRSGWARRLAAAIVALHVPAEPGFPANPVRGVPLGDRADAVAERFARLDGVAGIPELERRWADGLAAPRWSGPPLWIHGDLHPGNLVVRGGELVGLIDFGDVTAGDPAYDLAAAWLAFDDHGRREFLGALDGRYDEATWRRAHAWAGAVTAMLLDASDDNPPYALLGRECLAELAGG